MTGRVDEGEAVPEGESWAATWMSLSDRQKDVARETWRGLWADRLENGDGASAAELMDAAIAMAALDG